MDAKYPVKKPVYLYYRDALEVLEKCLLRSPLVQDYLSFTTYKLFETSAKLVRIYDSWLSGDRAWNLQVCR